MGFYRDRLLGRVEVGAVIGRWRCDDLWDKGDFGRYLCEGLWDKAEWQTVVRWLMGQEGMADAYGGGKIVL